MSAAKNAQTTDMQPQHQSPYLLEVHIAQCMKFKGVISVIKDLLFDCNITFDDTGMKICKLDNSKVALVHFKAPANARAFSYYYCERPQLYGISTTALHKYLGYISQNNRYTLKIMVDRNKTYEMILEIVSDDDTDTQRFYMKLLDLEPDGEGLDGERFNCIINIPSDKFLRYCRSHALIGNEIDIITVGDQVELYTEDAEGGGDRASSVIKTTSGNDDDDDDDDDDDNDDGDDDGVGGDGASGSVDSDGEAEASEAEDSTKRRSKRKPVAKKRQRGGGAVATKGKKKGGTGGGGAADEKKRTSVFVKDKDDPIAGRFALKFLQMFAKAQSLSPNVIIYFKKDFPLVLQYKMSELGDLKFALAPRVSPNNGV